MAFSPQIPLARSGYVILHCAEIIRQLFARADAALPVRYAAFRRGPGELGEYNPVHAAHDYITGQGANGAGLWL